MTAALPLRIRQVARLDDVSAEEWDGVAAPRDVQTTHRFVKLCQDSGIEGADYRHLLAYGADGGLVAVATLSHMTVSLDLLSPRSVRAAIRGLRRVRPGLLRLPVVIGGLPVSFGRSCLAIRSCVDAETVVAAIAGAAEGFAVEKGASLVCFKEFTPEEDQRLGSLVRRGYVRAASLPSCSVAELSWPSFGAYLAAMRAGYRRQALATLRRREAAHLTVRTVDDFGEWCPRLFALYEQVMERAEFRLERLNLEFFRRLNRDLPGESAALLLESDGALVAAAVVLKGGGGFTFLLAGLDYERHRSCQAYPNLVLGVVAEAIRSGARRLELGQTSYALKGRLGGSLVPRTLYLRSRSAVGQAALAVGHRLLFPRHAQRARRVFR
jgi:predicted N-acyltransferase